MHKIKNGGQTIALLPVILTVTGGVITAIVGGWASANTRVSEIDTKVEVVMERENNHYQEVKEKLDGIEDKLDLILSNKTKK